MAYYFSVGKEGNAKPKFYGTIEEKASKGTKRKGRAEVRD